MTTTKDYDLLNRLTNITSVDDSMLVLDSHVYAYNSANQRTAVTNADNARWVYTYDSLGQVVSGKKYWSDNTVVAGQQFTYTTHFCAYDGNGNVTALVNGSDGSVTANYEYGPFGEVIRATGLMASANPFRFSTKYQDGESDFLYYGDFTTQAPEDG